MTIPLRTRGIEAAPSSAHGPIPFTRLVRVELAKATDTRAARWLLALVALSTAAMMLAPILAPTRFDQTYASYLEVTAVAVSILLPVVAVLMFTGEWTDSGNPREQRACRILRPAPEIDRPLDRDRQRDHREADQEPHDPRGAQHREVQPRTPHPGAVA